MVQIHAEYDADNHQDVWMVLYKVSVFRSSRIFNMAAMANNMLWLAEISKIFFSETNELHSC
jgi:hypothetical protein